MYGALWRVLPGPWPVKALLALLLAAGVVYALFIWVFPWAVAEFDLLDMTVGEQGAGD